MLDALIAAVTIANLGDRPETLTGRAGNVGYQKKLEQYLNLDGVTVRREFVFGDCKTVTYASAGFEPFDLPRNQSPIDFFSHEKMAGQGADIVIAVREKVDVQGCGKTHRLNFVAWKDKRNTLPNMSFLTDGETIAPDSAQQQASMDTFNTVQALRRAKGRDGCKRVPLVYDTRIETRPEPDTTKGPWTEIWSLATCEVKHDFRVTFTPVDGTAYAKIELLTPDATTGSVTPTP